LPGLNFSLIVQASAYFSGAFLVNSYSKILVVQTGFLGDLVLSTPVLSVLSKLFPDSSIDVLCTKQSSPLLSNHPLVSGVLVYDKRASDSGFRGLLRKVKELRSHGYDAVFSLHKSYRTSLLLYLSGIPQRFGFKEASLPFLYTKTSPRKDLNHEVKRNIAVLRACGVSPEEIAFPLSLGLTKDLHEYAHKVSQGIPSPYVTIAPGSVWKTKRWTKEGFARLALQLIEKGKGIVLIGGPDDVESGNYIEAHLREHVKDTSCFINTIGKISLMQSAGLIANSECIVSNDSAPLHIAAAVSTPVIALFCATIPEFGFTPWMVPHRIVEKKGMPCRPCGAHGGMSCPLGTNACQIDILPSDVLIEMRELYHELSMLF
jgi:heptosyltransferase II